MSTVPRISPRWVPGYIGPRLARMLSRLAPFSARDTNTPCGLSAYLHRDASLMMLADLTIVLAKGEQTRLQVPFESCSEGMQRNLGPLIAPWTGRLVGLRQPWNRLHDDLGEAPESPLLLLATRFTLGLVHVRSFRNGALSRPDLTAWLFPAPGDPTSAHTRIANRKLRQQEHDALRDWFCEELSVRYLGGRSPQIDWPAFC